MIEARLVLGLAERFGCLPDDVYAMDASVLRLLDIEDLMGWREPAEPED